MLILGGLAVAIFFIISDALDKKIENCMFMHFHSSGLVDQYNVSWNKDPARISYTTDECQSFIDQGRKKTSLKIDEMAVPPCFKKHFKEVFLDTIMLKNVMDRYNIEAPEFFSGLKKNVTAECSRT